MRRQQRSLRLASRRKPVSPLIIRTPAGGAFTLGPNWLAAVGHTIQAAYPALPVTLVLDCADETGRALGGLRMGLTDIVLDAPDNVLDKLRQMGAIVWPRRGPALDLTPCRRFRHRLPQVVGRGPNRLSERNNRSPALSRDPRRPGAGRVRRAA